MKDEDQIALRWFRRHEHQMGSPVPAETFRGSILWSVLLAEIAIRPWTRAAKRAFRRTSG